MKILIKNCTLISMNERIDKILYNIDILIHDNKIEKISENIKESTDKVIDASGKIVLPGLINTHAHIPMSIFRETIDGYNLQDWLNKKIWPMEDKLNDDDIYYASYLSFIEMVKTGTTTINDMYFMTDSIIRAMNDVGVRLQTTRCIMSFPSYEERLNELEKLINKYKDKYDLLTFNVGVHGLYTNSLESVDKSIELANKYNLNINMHFCENSKELEDVKNLNNDTPINILKDKFQNNKTLLAHAVKLTEEEIDEISKMNNISISHCPISNLKLGCGIAKINYMLKKGINISIGTDGQGSGSNLDLFESMKFTALLQKGILEDPECMNSYDVLKMATINGAKALGLENKIGSIEEGKLADMIIIDINDVKIKPINNLISQIIYNVKGNNVDTTIINGKILMENKKLINIKENEIYIKCEEIINRIATN